MTASLLSRCFFNPTSGGTGSFTVASAVTGYMTPAQAGAVDGQTYAYFAESSDKTQWEVGRGVYTVSGTVLTRVVLFSSNSNSTVNFSTAPVVGITALAEDLHAITPLIRGSNIQSSSASSYSVSWPTGTLAGDLAIIFMGHGFGLSSVPTGWTAIDNQTGTNWNGAVIWKQLTSSDISTGSVTVSFAGSFNGVLSCITFIGVPGALRTFGALRDGSGASSRTVSTSLWTPLITDLGVYFGSNRAANNSTSSLGTQLQQVNASNASGVLAAGNPPANGTVSVTFSYPSGTPTGDYQAVLIYQPQ